MKVQDRTETTRVQARPPEPPKPQRVESKPPEPVREPGKGTRVDTQA